MAQAAKEKENHFSAYKLFAQTREAKDPAWLVNLRQRAGESFEELDFPTTRNEAWKYTNVARAANVPMAFAPRANVALDAIAPHLLGGPLTRRLIFVNGHVSTDLSHVQGLTPGVRVMSIARALELLAPSLE